MVIDIRQALQFEASYLTKLALRSKAHWGYPDEFMEKCKKELSIFPEDIEKELLEYRVAEIGNTIVGFYKLERISGIVFELHSLFVEPRHIGSGVGRALIDHAKNTARELGGHVITLQSDTYTDAFYSQMGAIRIGNKESCSISGRLLSVFEINLMGFGCNRVA